ncbi:hypothetical protein VQH23_07445 [Pararoseomonas sp. SCSIO 73927]|uniref:hypothetical protein n=1 Tax=Pararoseomonas sp. SCSIO 73927 TaxID=3114537 RepID=UPI0030D0B559
MAGPALDFAASHLEATARAYDPSKHEAPIVVGHPALNAPAYGWVSGLAAEADGLHATPKQVDPAFAALVDAGRFKKISASFWRPDAPDNPTPGVYALRHVGFLGAAPPAVLGLKPVSFAAEAEGVATVEFSADAGGIRSLGWMLGDIAGLFRGLRERMIAKDGQEEADRVLPNYSIQSVLDEAKRIRDAGDTADAAPAFAATITPPAEEAAASQENDVTEQERAAREAALNEREQALASRETAVADRETAFAAQAQQVRLATATDFCARLVREARLPQGLAPRAAAVLASMPVEGAVSFAAAGGQTTEETPAAALQALLAALPQSVSFSAVNDPEPAGHGAAGVAEFGGQRVDSDRMELHRKALAYQAANPTADYLTAVSAVEMAA